MRIAITGGSGLVGRAVIEAGLACENEVFMIAAENTAANMPSLDIARRYYPKVAILGDLSENSSFFDCEKARRLLGWADSSCQSYC